ncbi:MAG: hypothetical protein MJ219_02485 [Mycoplasmoidaceae bacterium]|nr:hypothetical protein [Mycoplasmoidaceae bacterium]
MDQLVDFIKPLNHCIRAELLSFHNLASDKYKSLGIDYPCKDMKMLSTPEFERLKTYLDKQIHK